MYSSRSVHHLRLYETVETGHPVKIASGVLAIRSHSSEAELVASMALAE